MKKRGPTGYYATTPIVLVIAHDYPPFTGSESSPAARWVEAVARDGLVVEVIAPSDTEEEFVHLDAGGNLVHRIAASRSYAFGMLERLAPAVVRRVDSPRLRLATRAAEKLVERVYLWNRTIRWRETLLGEVALVAPAAASALWQVLAPVSGAVGHRSAAQPVATLDLVICTYDRVAELIVSIDSALAEVDGARQLGLNARLRVMYQNEDLPERLRETRPDLLRQSNLSLELSAPPGLTLARNAAIASSQADLVVFVDDDVKLEPGFVAAYVGAARNHPAAIGFVGRIASPSEPVVGRPRAIGQVRPTGYVDVNYNSVNKDAVYVPMTPMGASMAFRRERMNRLFGKAWFDAGLTGSAIREESTLALQNNRAGEYLVFVPDAALTHFEAARGGCNNRGLRSLGQRIEHQALESLFLARLYQGVGWLHVASSLRSAWLKVGCARGPRDMLSTSAVHLAGYFHARRRYKALHLEARKALSLVSPTGPDPRGSSRLRLARRGGGNEVISRLEAAKARAQLYDLIRFRLTAGGYLEVETPALVPMPGMEPHITAFESDYRPELGATVARKLYLHTSPEYAMKRLLAEGFGSVFQIAKVFRNGEVAEAHNPEFTMLEFYRSPGTVDALMDDLETVIRRAGAQLGCRTPGLLLEGPFERLTVREAFQRHTGQPPPPDEDQFFRVMLAEVEPHLGRTRPTFLTEYPASMASLARLKPDDPSVSERFELYAGGAELANGFGELNDPVEQRRRLVAEQAQRREAGRAVYPLDERFVEAVGRMPPSAGVAVGLDRLLMVLLGVSRIAEVLLFPAESEWV